MKRLTVFSLLLVFFVSCNKHHDPGEPTDTNIGTPITSDVARQSLLKGINLENWFNDYSNPAQFGTRFSSGDLARVKAEGFTYIRLPIGTNILFQTNNPGELSATTIGFVDNAVKNAIEAGLAVVLDPIHNSDETFEKNLATIPAFTDKAKAYWKALAKYFSKYPTDKIFFEIYNEPHVGTSKSVNVSVNWWWPMQLKLIQSIREVTANHYIIAGAEGWNGRTLLTQMTPYDEKNVIYNFHTYDPFLFTHQGANWVDSEAILEARNVPFPSSPEAVEPLVEATDLQSLKDELNWYGSQRYNADSLVNWIASVNTWATSHDVLVTCNEFGSYKPYSPRASRLQWIHDMRTALEQNNICWAMWEYDEGFGVINYTNDDRNQPVEDEEALTALGLN